LRRTLDPRTDELVHAIRRDKTHGASHLARQALAALRLSAQHLPASGPEQLKARLMELVKILIEARPSMAALQGAALRFVECLNRVEKKRRTLPSFRSHLQREVEKLIKALGHARNCTAQRAARLIRQNQAILTHSYSATCLEAFRYGRRLIGQLYVTESRPRFEGRDTAAQAARLGIPVTIITDAEAGHFVAHCNLIVVGADSIVTDGSLINKMGTYLIALAARAHGVPFYVVSESIKISPRGRRAIELEEKEAREVLPPSHKIAARNIYFDHTPARLITAIVTEFGVWTPAKVRQYAARWRTLLTRVL
jgi:ribose 1,5-bisphosphate isomerase